MANFDEYKSVPVGSLLTRERAEEERYIKQLPELPPGIINLLMSSKTGAYVRGLVRSYKLGLEFAPIVAFSILRISFGEKSLAQLPSMLSTALRLPNDKAQAMAREIEKELFAPIMLELNQYLEEKNRTKGSMAEKIEKSTKETQARNVLNLKEVETNRRDQRMSAGILREGRSQQKPQQPPTTETKPPAPPIPRPPVTKPKKENGNSNSFI